MNLIVKEIKLIDDIKAILCHPAIYDTITDDECPLSKDFEPPVNDEYLYVGGYVKGEIIGLMVYHKYLDGNECHIQVLPRHRKDYALKFGQQALLHRGTAKLYAEIPDLYKNVLNFALLNDFRIIDVKEDCYIKNGNSYNINVLEYNDGIC